MSNRRCDLEVLSLLMGKEVERTSAYPLGSMGFILCVAGKKQFGKEYSRTYSLCFYIIE